MRPAAMRGLQYHSPVASYIFLSLLFSLALLSGFQILGQRLLRKRISVTLLMRQLVWIQQKKKILKKVLDKLISKYYIVNGYIGDQVSLFLSARM